MRNFSSNSKEDQENYADKIKGDIEAKHKTIDALLKSKIKPQPNVPVVTCA
jgi:hypothetical protein